ncbi:MAG: acyl-CoA dehydrogenase, partial [bacterium]|nr:acyl-CoA dehydrogenase [bacterium]
KEHSMFRDALRRYFEKEVTPHVDQWEEDGIVPSSAWKKFGAQGFLCPWVPEEYGGLGADFLYSFILNEEISRTNCNGFFVPLHADIVVPYIFNLGTEAQKKRWLPGCVSGDTVAAVAMTEPDAGSDLAAIRTTAVRDGDNYIINGQKTFISNGHNCGLAIVAVKTDPDAVPP